MFIFVRVCSDSVRRIDDNVTAVMKIKKMIVVVVIIVMENIDDEPVVTTGRRRTDDSPSSLWWLLLLLLLPYSCCLLAGLWLRRRKAQDGKGKHKHKYLHFGSLEDDVIDAEADSDQISVVHNSDFDLSSGLPSEAQSSGLVESNPPESAEDSILLDL